MPGEIRSVELKTERLILRPFRIRDVDDVFEYVSDPGFAAFVPSVPPPASRRLSEKLVAALVSAPWQTKPAFAIVLDARVVGGVDLTVSERDETAELGYSVARAHWDKGVAAEAVQAVMDWAFEQLGLARVYAIADVRNRRSWRVMSTCSPSGRGCSGTATSWVTRAAERRYFAPRTHRMAHTSATT